MRFVYLTADNVNTAVWVLTLCGLVRVIGAHFYGTLTAIYTCLQPPRLQSKRRGATQPNIVEGRVKVKLFLF